MSSYIYEYSKSLTLCIRPSVPVYTLLVVQPLVEAAEYYAVILYKERILCHVNDADRPALIT
jgi:hypothetical protein